MGTALANRMTTRSERRTAAAQQRAPQLRTISDRDVQLLKKLDAARVGNGHQRAWLRVRDLGGETHSWHANQIQKLERHGLVTRSNRDETAVVVYKISALGRKVLAAIDKVDAAE